MKKTILIILLITMLVATGLALMAFTNNASLGNALTNDYVGIYNNDHKETFVSRATLKDNFGLGDRVVANLVFWGTNASKCL